MKYVLEILEEVCTEVRHMHAAFFPKTVMDMKVLDMKMWWLVFRDCPKVPLSPY